MSSALDPRLDLAAEAMVAAGARFVVIGGFAVIANRFGRTTEGIDFLVPNDPSNDRSVVAALRELRAVSLHNGGLLCDEHLLGYDGLQFLIASPRSLAGIRRVVAQPNAAA